MWRDFTHPGILELGSSWDFFPQKGTFPRQLGKEYKSSASGGDSCQVWRRGIPSREMLYATRASGPPCPAPEGISHARGDLLWPKQCAATHRSRWNPVCMTVRGGNMSGAHHAPLLRASLLVVMRQSRVAGDTKRQWWWAKWLVSSGNTWVPMDQKNWLRNGKNCSRSFGNKKKKKKTDPTPRLYGPVSLLLRVVFFAQVRRCRG